MRNASPITVAGLLAAVAIGTAAAPTSAQAEAETRFLLGAQGFETYCLTPIRAGEKIAPDLKPAGKDQWWLSNGVVVKGVENSKGQIGCQVYPSAGQRVAPATLDALVQNFDVWTEAATKAGTLREYRNCESLGDGVRRVLDTPPNLSGQTVRVVFETRPDLSHFVIIAAQTSVLTPPADCAPWET